MSISLGVVELNSVAGGVITGDEMLKSAGVNLITAQPTCPGKYVIVVGGQTSEVETSVRAGQSAGGVHVVDTVVIPRIDDSVIPAIMCSTAPQQKEAVGVIETFSLTGAILAADSAVKAASVELIEVRLGRGLGGKSFVILTGSVSNCTSAVEAAKEELKASGMILNTVVVPSLHEDMFKALL